MSLRGWLDEFPGNWSYSGEAKLVLGSFQRIFKINITFLFVEEIKVEVKIFWDDISSDEIFDIGDNFANTSNHKLIVQESLVLIGNTYFPGYSSYIQPTEYYVNRVITYEKSFEKNNLSYFFDFCNMRVYLNDQYSGYDSDVISEYINIQRYSKGKYTNVLENKNQGLYCQLNSGYKVQCGQQYAIHKDHNIFFDSKNIETLYKSSFIGIEIDKIFYHSIKDNARADDILSHIEKTFREICSFLSVISKREILPLYYEYTFHSQGRYFWGRVIPVCEVKAISKITKAGNNPYLNFHHDVELFLECCPLNEKLVYGLYGLKQTVLDSASPLQLLSAYSALEYFYSFWLWEMDGISKLIKAKKEKNNLIRFQKISERGLEKLKDNKQTRIPSLSLIIRLFMHDIDIDWEQYLNEDISINPQFIDLRDDLLHGVIIEDEIKISYAADKVTKIAKKVLFKIMKQISNSSNKECYEHLYIESREPKLSIINNGWSDIQKAHDELNNNEKNKMFWDEL